MKPLGFIGVGLMGQPMAINLAKAGVPLLVWNRSADRMTPVIGAGAMAAGTPARLFARCDVVVLMLATPDAIDSVLGRSTPGFAAMVSEKLIINTGTASPDYSARLALDIERAGGRYVEAPVSGSRQQAEDIQLVAMVAGRPDDVAKSRELLEPICRKTFDCGPIPGGLKMKLAVNHFMIVMVTGLAEAFHFAEGAGLDAEAFRDVLEATPVASNVSRVKAAKLAARDWQPQATMADALKNIGLIADAAGQAGGVSPLLQVCLDLFRDAVAGGRSSADMVAVRTVFEDRSRRNRANA